MSEERPQGVPQTTDWEPFYLLVFSSMSLKQGTGAPRHFTVTSPQTGLNPDVQVIAAEVLLSKGTEIRHRQLDLTEE